MFGWLYRRIGNAVINQIEEWLQDPKNIEQLTKLADSLVDREAQRVYSSLGKSIGNVAPVEGVDLQSLLGKGGGLSSKKLVGTAINWWLSKKDNKQVQSSLP